MGDPAARLLRAVAVHLARLRVPVGDGARGRLAHDDRVVGKVHQPAPLRQLVQQIPALGDVAPEAHAAGNQAGRVRQRLDANPVAAAAIRLLGLKEADRPASAARKSGSHFCRCSGASASDTCRPEISVVLTPPSVGTSPPAAATRSSSVNTISATSGDARNKPEATRSASNPPKSVIANAAAQFLQRSLTRALGRRSRLPGNPQPGVAVHLVTVGPAIREPDCHPAREFTG
jgi:hypothetical protein